MTVFQEPQKPDRVRPPGMLRIVLALVVLLLVLLIVYGSLLAWLARRALTLDQLGLGGILVLLALWLSVRDLIREARRPSAAYTSEGLLLLFLGFAALWWAARWTAAALPLVLLSFCLSFAGLVAFLFGDRQVRHFYPAIGVFLLFGLLVGLFPTLDWPLRTVAARWSGRLLTAWGLPVHLAVVPNQPPELLLAVRHRVFSVASECSGFGLLSSALILSVLLALRLGLTRLSFVGLLAAATGISLLVNVLRIAIIALAATHTGWPYAWIHEGVGTALYLLGLWMVWRLAESDTPSGSKDKPPGKESDPAQTDTPPPAG